ncbi:hypothetical protein ETB97_007429 [Aspergillus alliaceus]|uniref:Uncharacterized protein n=1 Tax=Petromyces alliaceus TaxID=209559 RepID=A0A8H5ZU69_PETAA|nr:hypothetical protein ETB97_007429 [Aspergillus burnettii]
MEILRENQLEMQRRADHQPCSVSEIVCNAAQEEGLLFTTCCSVQSSFTTAIIEPNRDQELGFELIELHDPTELIRHLSRNFSVPFADRDGTDLLDFDVFKQDAAAHIVKYPSLPVQSLYWDSSESN